MVASGFDKKNYEAAVLYFENASQAKPRDAEPYYQLGLAYLGENKIGLAYRAFGNAAALNPRHTGAHLKMAELASANRDKRSIPEAQKHAEAVLKLLPDDPDALYVLAVVDLRMGKPEGAQAHLEQALRKSPGHLKSWELLSQAKLARNDVAGAEQALLQAAAGLPKSPAPRVDLGQFYLARGRADEAERQFRQALAIDPANGPALMLLGAVEVKAGHTDQAEQTYRRASALPDRQYKSVHAEFLFRSGKRDQAVAEFANLAAADPADLNVRTRLMEAYLTLNRAGDAEKFLTAVLKKNGSDQDALMRRGGLYVDSGKYAEAEADLNQVLHFHKDSAEARYLLAKIGQGRANATLQKQHLEQALKIDPGFLAARIDLARALFAARGAGAALSVLEKAPKNQMNAVPLILERNWLLLAIGRREEARQAIDKLLAAGNVPEALVQDAVMKLDRKDFDGTRKSAEEALSKAPGDTLALMEVVRSYTAQKQTAAAVQFLREYAAKQPASAPVQQFLGQILSAEGDRAGARRAFEAARAARPGFVEADFALAQLDAAEGKPDQARQRLSGVVSSDPGNKAAHLLLAQIEMKNGKTSAAIEQYRKAVALDDEDVTALNALAYLLAEGSHRDEALRYAEKAKELAPGNPAVDDTLGWVYYQQGLYQVAVDQLETAAAGTTTAIRKYHLAMAYLKAGDPARGRQTLEEALKMDPKLPEAQAARQTFGIGPN